MARQTAAERKLEYLKAGANMLTDFSPEQAGLIAVEALANVKVSDVAERAGVTKGAVYHIWPTQELFRKDLLQRLLQQNHQAAISRQMAFLMASHPQAGPLRLTPAQLRLSAAPWRTLRQTQWTGQAARQRGYQHRSVHKWRRRGCTAAPICCFWSPKPAQPLLARVSP